MKKIAITGATGFIGYRTVRALAGKGYQVTALGRNVATGKALENEGIPFVRCELSDLNRMKQVFKQQDCVIHCAALTRAGRTFEEYRQANVLGTRNVMEAMKGSSVQRWIYLSHAGIYSGGTDRAGVHEDDPMPAKNPDPYLESKRAADQEVSNYVIVPSIILRPQLVFGVGNRRLDAYISRFSRWKRLPRIDMGASLVDPVYIDNFLHAIIASVRAKDEKYGRAYNISNGEPVENFPFLSQLAEIQSGKFIYPLNMQRVNALTFAAILAKIWSYFSTEAEPPLSASFVRMFSESLSLNIENARMELEYRPKATLKDAFRTLANKKR